MKNYVLFPICFPKIMANIVQIIKNSTVNSSYFVSHDDIPDLISKYDDNWIFGDLNEYPNLIYYHKYTK